TRRIRSEPRLRPPFTRRGGANAVRVRPAARLGIASGQEGTVFDVVLNTRVDPLALGTARAARLPDPHSNPVPRDSRGPDRPRRPRARPDRYGQDGRIRAADDRPARRITRRSAPDPARTRPRAHA